LHRRGLHLSKSKRNGTLYYPLDTPITPTYEWQIKEDGHKSCYDYVLEEEIDADYCTDLVDEDSSNVGKDVEPQISMCVNKWNVRHM
jgi:hypothetical protein